jgi:ribonuclease-3
MRSGGPKRASILADALEAIIGAVYLDAGFNTAQALVHRLFEAVEINPHMQAIGKDAKTELQEWLQGRKMKVPVYTVVGTTGAAHKQSFDVECEVPELRLSERGIGGSRRAGEQAAAAAMLQTIKAKVKS